MCINSWNINVPKKKSMWYFMFTQANVGKILRWVCFWQGAQLFYYPIRYSLSSFFFLLSSNIVVVKIIFSEADYKLAANSKIYFKCKLICTDINTNIWLLLIIKAIKQNCNRDFFQRSKGKIHFLNKNLPQNLRSYKFINILQIYFTIRNLHTKLARH